MQLFYFYVMFDSLKRKKTIKTMFKKILIFGYHEK